MKKKQHLQKSFKPLNSLGFQAVVPGATISGNVVPAKPKALQTQCLQGFRAVCCDPAGFGFYAI